MSGGGWSGEGTPGSAEGPAMREVNFIMNGQEHVDWPAEGLSSTSAPGQPALRRAHTRCGASPANLIQSAFLVNDAKPRLLARPDHPWPR